MMARRYQAPLKPKVGNAGDTSNFDDLSSLGEMQHPFELTAEQQAAFRDF
jgi:hypothetical protein